MANQKAQGKLEGYFNYIAPDADNKNDCKIHEAIKKFFGENTESSFTASDLRESIQNIRAYRSLEKQMIADVPSIIVRLASVGILEDIEKGKEGGRHKYEVRHFDASKTYENMVLDLICERSKQSAPETSAEMADPVPYSCAAIMPECPCTFDNDSDRVLHALLEDSPAIKMKPDAAQVTSQEPKKKYGHLIGKVVADLSEDGLVRIGIYDAHNGYSKLTYLKSGGFGKNILIGDRNHLRLMAGDIEKNVREPMYVNKEELMFFLYCSGMPKKTRGSYQLEPSCFFTPGAI